MKHERLKLMISCLNDIPSVDLDIVYSKVKFYNLGFFMEKCDNGQCDLEFGLLCKLND